MFQNALHSKSKLFVNKKQCAKLSVYLIRRKLFQKIINTRACRIATVTAIYNHGIISWYNKPFSGFCFSESCLWSPSFSEKLTRSADSSVSIHYLITPSMRVLHPFFRVHVIMVNRGVSSSVTPLQVLVLYSTANDPQPQLIPRPQMIPKMDRKWSSTASDPQSRPQMIPKEK